MSKSVDIQRRNLIKTAVFGGISLLINSRLSFADAIGDLIAGSKINQIISVRFWPSDVYTRLTIEAEAAIKAKYFTLYNPKRFVIDIEDSQLNTILKNLNSKSVAQDPIIQDIKVGQFNQTTVRIVLYLKQDVLAQTSSTDPILLSGVSYKYRYVFDMYPKTKGDDLLNDQLLALLQIKSDDKKNTINQLERQKPYPELKNPTTSEAQFNKNGKIVVMLDPGHGGEDPGASGPTGTHEKHVVLDIARRLTELINNTDYITAQMTRNQDIFIPLGTRVAIARKAKADLFISIHADAFTSPLASGSSVFMLSDGGASSSFARWLAKTQNASDNIGGMSFKSKDPSVNKILLDMTQTYTLRKSNNLGAIVLGQLGKINNLHSKNVERAGFAVLKSPDIPSILVETAFISNLAEEEQLKNPDYRYKIANQVFTGLKQYINNNYKLT